MLLLSSSTTTSQYIRMGMESKAVTEAHNYVAKNKTSPLYLVSRIKYLYRSLLETEKRTLDEVELVVLLTICPSSERTKTLKWVLKVDPMTQNNAGTIWVRNYAQRVLLV